MAAVCAEASKALCNTLFSVATTWKLRNIVENTVVEFLKADFSDFLSNDSVAAPSSIAASGIAMSTSASAMRVLPGRHAVFMLTRAGSPTDFTPKQKVHCGVLTALAISTEASATLRITNKASGIVNMQISVDVTTSAEHNCVLLSVAVPSGIPDGALVLIDSMSIGGNAVGLNKLTSHIVIGYNHVPAPAGALFAAAAAGDVPGIVAALHRGESTEEMGDFGRTALIIACVNGHSDAALMLIKSGANIHALAQASPPLFWASRSGLTTVASELLAAGANVNLKDNRNYTALHAAVMHGCTSLVTVLLAAGANVDAKQHHKCTPLHLAASGGHVSIVMELMAAGADLDAVTKYGKTPLETAQSNHHPEVVAVLSVKKRRC